MLGVAREDGETPLYSLALDAVIRICEDLPLLKIYFDFTVYGGCQRNNASRHFALPQSKH